jgi:hypothetical protein
MEKKELIHRSDYYVDISQLLGSRSEVDLACPVKLGRCHHLQTNQTSEGISISSRD